MAWQKAPPELIAQLAQTMQGYDCDYKLTFSFPAYYVGGHMFAGLFEDQFWIRLSESDQAALLAAYPEVSGFSPMPGRPMKDYVVLPARLYQDATALHPWLQRAFVGASALAPKEPKRRAPGKK